QAEDRGLARGNWGDWSLSCPSSCGVCGIRTHVDTYSDSRDDTGLNGLKLYCCP
ncbi:VMO1 protein, partial [Bombycilla garrulus]|nr:VMO1 protein [Bombycilla garrulus]